MTYSLLAFCCLYLLYPSNQIHAETLLDLIKKDSFLKSGNVSILEHEDAKYLVSVGASTVATSVPTNWKDARIKAKLLSQQQISKFINDINVNASEAIEEVVVVFSTDNGIKTRKVDSRYIEDIKETSEGSLTDIITIGDWKDQNNYYYAIGKKLAR